MRTLLNGILLATAIGVLQGIPDISVAASGNGYSLVEYQASAEEDFLCNLQPVPGAQAMWIIEAGAHRLGRVDLANGTIEKNVLPGVTPEYLSGVDPRVSPCDMLIDPFDRLWFNYQSQNAVGYLNQSPPHQFQLIKFDTPRSVPMSMQLGTDGMIYVTLTAANKFAQIDPSTGALIEFQVPTEGSGIIGGSGSPDGKGHWFVLRESNQLLFFDYATQAIETIDVPTPNSAPFVIRAYEDGLWFTMFGASSIGHMDYATRTFTRIPLASEDARPIGIIEGKDGFLYSNLMGSNSIARIDRTAKQAIHEFPLVSGTSYPTEVKLGPDGAIWVTQANTGKLARLWMTSFGRDPGFPQQGEKY